MNGRSPNAVCIIQWKLDPLLHRLYGIFLHSHKLNGDITTRVVSGMASWCMGTWL